MRNQFSSFIVHLSSVALLFALCAQADQWTLDGRKILTVADPSGLRVQLGAVAGTSGTSTNLTVYDTLEVSGVAGSVPAVISGSDAGDYAGTYAYAGTHPYYGAYFANTLGRVLFPDADYWLNGEWALGPALGSVAFGNAGSDWYETDGWNQVDIVMDGTPFYGVVGGDLSIEGAQTVGGTLEIESGRLVVNAVSGSDNVLMEGVNSSGITYGHMGEGSAVGWGGLVFRGLRTIGSGAGVSFYGVTPGVGTTMGMAFRAMSGSTVTSYDDYAGAPKVYQFSMRESGAWTELLNIQSDKNVHLPIDSQKILLGAGKDAGIWYDGNNLHIDAALVGSGTIVLDNLPVSDTGLPIGGVWNDAGTLKIK